MGTVQVVRKQENAYVKEDMKQILFSKLDESIDDFENGRVISEEEMWAELES